MNEQHSVEELILTMKDTSEMMVDLAYSALFYDSRSMAEEVQHLEEEMDDLLSRLQREALEAVREKDLDIDAAWVLLRVAQGAEAIANSALEIADVVLRDVELHPVIRESIRESDSTITKVRLSKKSPLAGRTLRDLELETETGMRIVAVKRRRQWHSRVTGDFRMEPEDLLVATGPTDAEEGFLRLADPEWDEDDGAD